MNKLLTQFTGNDPWRIVAIASLLGAVLFWIVLWFIQGQPSPEAFTLSPAYENGIVIALNPEVP